MATVSLTDVAQSAGDELALRLRIPCDIVDVHRLNSSRRRIYSSLRYGAFLLAYAPLEGFFTQLTRYTERASGRALPLNLDKIQRELDLRWPDARFEANLWEGRTRQQPTRSGSRSEWAFLKGGRLKDYLSDMKRLRDLLSHGGNPFSVTNSGRTLWEVQGGWSLRLMGVEGFIQFAEDLAEQALLEAGVLLEKLPTWPEPQRSGISLTGLPALPNRDRLAGRRGTGTNLPPSKAKRTPATRTPGLSLAPFPGLWPGNEGKFTLRFYRCSTCYSATTNSTGRSRTYNLLRIPSTCDFRHGDRPMGVGTPSALS